MSKAVCGAAVRILERLYVERPIPPVAVLMRATGCCCDSRNGTYGMSASLGLDIRGADHLGPLFGFVGDQFAEVGGRTGKHNAAEVGEPRFNLGISEARVDLLVEPFDDLGG